MPSVQVADIIVTLNQIHLTLGAIKALLIMITGILLTYTLFEMFKKGNK
jgi:hypothetical protein